MAGPLIAAAIPAAVGLGSKLLAAAGGWAGVGAGAASSFLPSIIDTLLSSKTPEEAAQALAPMREAKIAQLIGSGKRRQVATQQVDEEMQGEIQAKMQEGSLPEWANIALSIAAGVAGSKLGGKLATKAPKAQPAPAKTTPDAGLSKGDPLAALSKRPGEPVPKAPRTMEMEPKRTPGPMDRGMDDGSEAIMQDAPQTGLTAPFRKFDADIDAPSSGRTGRPARPVQEAEFEVVQPQPQRRIGHTPDERGFIMPSSSRELTAPFGGGIDPLTRANSARRGASRRPSRADEPQGERRNLPVSDETITRLRSTGTADDRLAAFAEAEAMRAAEADAVRTAAYDEVRRSRGYGRPPYYEE